ncbi:hypothetical protein Tco_0668131 [Tanacetum coccineum]
MIKSEQETIPHEVRVIDPDLELGYEVEFETHSGKGRGEGVMQTWKCYQLSLDHCPSATRWGHQLEINDQGNQKSITAGHSSPINTEAQQSPQSLPEITPFIAPSAKERTCDALLRVCQESESEKDSEESIKPKRNKIRRNKIQLTPSDEDECHKLLTNKVDWSNPEGHQILRNIYEPLPLGGPPGQVSIQPQFFFNRDLDYLLTGDKEAEIALSISKLKALVRSMASIITGGLEEGILYQNKQTVGPQIVKAVRVHTCEFSQCSSVKSVVEKYVLTTLERSFFAELIYKNTRSGQRISRNLHPNVLKIVPFSISKKKTEPVPKTDKD